MSKKQKKNPDEKILTFDVDPYTSIALLVINMSPEGYVFKSYDRKGNKAKATYVRKLS